MAGQVAADVEPSAVGSDTARRLPQRPGLDGVRGLAVVAVLLYHSGFRWARGGFLGVTTFFVLSGFLITALLLRERDSCGAISLPRFWERRARRLVPAVLVLLLGICALAAAHLIRVSTTATGDAVASLTWVANWRYVLAHRGYAAAFGGSSPFQHLWSLAVEEQFYLVLPFVVIAALGRRGRPKRARLTVVVVGATLASTALAALLHHPGGSITRAYYGTDARIAEPLVGVALALVLVGPKGLRTFRRTGWLDAAGLACAAGLAVLVGRLTESTDALYRGGFLAAALVSAGLIAAATQPRTLVARALGWRPLAFLGRISYGVYLFHWPIFLWLTYRRTGLSTDRLLALRLGVTLAAAVVSYVAFEQPVRHGRLPGRLALVGWMDISVGAVAALTATVLVPTATVGLAAPAAPEVPTSQVPVRGAADATLNPRPVETATPASLSKATAAPVSSAPPATPAPTAAPRVTTRHYAPGTGPLEGTGPDPNHPAPPPNTSSNPTALRVAVVGDSMARGLGNGLAAWAKNRSDVIVYNLAVPSCTISRGGDRQLSDGSEDPINGACAWWSDPSTQRYQYFMQFAPQVVVMQDAMNEVPDRTSASWSGYRHPGQPVFDTWLTQEYNAAISTFTRGGASLVALNAACADWETIGGGWAGYANGDGDRRVASLNTSTQALAGSGTQVHVHDLFSELCPNGTFSNTVDGVPNARPDGYHLMSKAELAVATDWLGPIVLQDRPTQAGVAKTPGA